jgi:hypothetical protein
VSATPAQYRPPPQLSPGRPGGASRHRKPTPVVPAWRGRFARVLVAGVAGAALLVIAWPAAARWVARTPSLAWVDQTDALGLQLASALGVQVSMRPEVVKVGIAAAPGYRNPLRGIGGLVPERIDMGVDFAGSGPIYAIGDAMVTSATGEASGWPGGGWITYQLTDGPDAGLTVYVAEDVVPTVLPGTRVSRSTVIAEMFSGSDGIETGWAQAGAAQSELPEAEAPEAGGLGSFPTAVGVNFDELLQSLGVPAAPNFGQPASGYVPAIYPANGG